MSSRQPKPFRMSSRVSELYDFSLLFLQRRGSSLRRDRGRYSQLGPFTRANSLTKRKRRNTANENEQGNANSSRSRRSNANSQENNEDTTEDESLTDSSTDSESDDESGAVSLEPDESYARECDIKINVEDIGVDGDNESINLTSNCVYNTRNAFQPATSVVELSEVQQINLPRVFVRIDYIPTRQLSIQDKQLVNKLIKHARSNKLPIMEDLLCPDCALIPKKPVTGICGHTRCIHCIIANGPCPCGMTQPHELHINILINNIIEKMVSKYNVFDGFLVREPFKEDMTLEGAELNLPVVVASGSACAMETRYFTMTLRARFEVARRFVWYGYHMDAIPHLAHIAASQGYYSKHARSLLSDCVAMASESEQDRFYVRKLYRSVRNLSAANWLAKSEIECVLCVDYFKDPVTTYCGHTYCRNCLLRSINYSHSCPLCKRSLDGLDVYEITETFFVTSLLYSIDSEKGPVTLEPDLIPLLMCAVALPSVPCPLFIIDARYWRSLSRLLANNKREFGMVARHKDNAIPEYGTILEIRDCVQLQNGGTLLSTVGKWRFKITQTDFMHGCDVARIERLSDIVPQDPAKIHYIQSLAASVANKAKRWISKIDPRIHFEIESVYGRMPLIGQDDTNWWESDDGPNWLWWLISILPLKSPIKILIFSAQCVMKRLIAVDLTLNTIDMLYKMNNVRKRKRISSN